ncbi:DUF4387 family protein [Streptomyces sp. NPDC015171]|uniref:DUF4387 family protein n=1 Tax=Streptomyces sp. NPDC015171 TaxID=3364945 RepID=UPI0036F6DB43
MTVCHSARHPADIDIDYRLYRNGAVLTGSALVATGFLNEELFAALYDTTPEQVLVVNHPRALAVKVSLPRPTVQGDLHDTDCYAGQQYAPLMDMDIPSA